MAKNAGRQSRAAIGRFLRPRSVAIVGASSTPGALGWNVMHSLEQGGFAGDIHLINPRRSEIDGKPCLTSIDDLPAGVDCAVLAIPQTGVIEAVETCARRGIGGVIIFSAGFAENGPEGRALQQKIAGIAGRNGMIVEGPNCLGFINYVDNAVLTFVQSPTKPLGNRKGIGIVSQSGAMATVISVALGSRDLGLSFFISTGNEAASGIEDYVDFLISDEHTKVITLIVEQFRDPARFLELANESRRANKPIVLLHPGRSAAARASAETHTGAMAGDYPVMRTKTSRAGVCVVDSIEELLDVSELYLRCPLPPNQGVAVLGESGSFKALTLDFCEAVGLALPALSPPTEKALREVLPEFIHPTNPMDMTAQGLVDRELYRKTIPPLLSDERFGTIVLGIILTDKWTSDLKLPPILETLKSLKPDKPVIFAGLDEGAEIPQMYVDELRALGVPFFPSCERVFRALVRFTESAALRTRSVSAGQPSVPQVTLTPGIMPEYASKRVLAAIGIPVPQGVLVKTLDEALAEAEKLGYPVAIKAQSAKLAHKSDAGGVVLNLPDPRSLTAAWKGLHDNIARAKPGLVLDGVLVESMGKPGAELIIGARNDREWGPVVLVGFGGILAEALHDIRLLPRDLSREEIVAELYRLKSSAMLRGFRSSPPLDVEAVAEIVALLGNLMLDRPEIKEVDINPVVAYPMGAMALDALILTAEE